jgi:hypothetical protein
MRQYAYKEKGGPPIVVTTHSPILVDALTPDEVWILEKSEDGFSTSILASDIPSIKELHAEGIPFGSLWYSGHGQTDKPAVREILQRRFNLKEDLHFRIHPHRGKGKLPENPLTRPNHRIEVCSISFQLN